MAPKLLVPLDGSPFGEAALPWAACLARTRQSSLVLAQAIPWPPSVSDGLMGGYVASDPYGEILAAEREAATDYLGSIRAQLTEDGLTVESVIKVGPPPTVLLDLADELGADTIVMATHGRGGLTRAILGSVTEYVVQHATIPVLLVRADSAAHTRAPSFTRLLVPLDGSALAEHALDLAAELAQPGSTLVLVRVEEVSSTKSRGESKTGGSDAHHDETEESAAEYLSRAAHMLVPKQLATRADVRRGAPGEQILAAASAHDADVILMVTHGRAGPARWWLGSVADDVVRHGDRPVMLVSARALVTRASEPYTVGDVMARELVTVRDDEPLIAVVRKLLRWRISAVPVVNADGDLVGIVSQREMIDWHDQTMSALAREGSPDHGEYARRLQSETAGRVMTRPTPTLEETAPLGRATHLFRERGIARVPVTRDGKLIGILTATGILKVMAARYQAAEGVATEGVATEGVATEGVENPSN